MFYKKTSTNYSKWDMFESSESDEEEKEPIVPKDDPTFKAMEKDFEDRAHKRRIDKKRCLEFKEKGNAAMKRGLYKSAYKYYTDCFEHRKDLLEIYTNRALAGLKLDHFQ